MRVAYRSIQGVRRRVWMVNAKIGSHPYGVVPMDRKPVPGKRAFVWAGNGHDSDVLIERILPDGHVLCSWV